MIVSNAGAIFASDSGRMRRCGASSLIFFGGGGASAWSGDASVWKNRLMTGRPSSSDCHRAPERHLRPLSAIVDMDWDPGPDAERIGQQIAQEVGARRLIHCSACHR